MNLINGRGFRGERIITDSDERTDNRPPFNLSKCSSIIEQINRSLMNYFELQKSKQKLLNETSQSRTLSHKIPSNKYNERKERISLEWLYKEFYLAPMHIR